MIRAQVVRVSLIGNNHKVDEWLKVWVNGTRYDLSGRGQCVVDVRPGTVILLDDSGNWLPFTVEITLQW